MRLPPSRLAPPAAVLCPLLAATVAVSAAAAQPAVTPATYNVLLARQVSPSEYPVAEYTAPGAYAAYGGAATAGVQTAPFTLLTAHATAATQGYTTTATATMEYSFRILGAAGTRVAATITADLFGSVVGLTQDERTLGRSRFEIRPSDPLAAFYDAAGSPIFSLSRSERDGAFQRLPGGFGYSFNAPVGFMVDANAQYLVRLEVIAQTATPGVVADASIDPVIAINPAQQGAYTLVLSPGVSNLAPTAVVPEPGTWALLGTGLLALGGVARRRRA